ncbi:hypothetical protein ACIBH1_31815 [Nonomuraea sp. NPDC050663]|uniref:hypothetical protein n=1 Tax=Nonomuraea sp. NPDC050663 TaxID=3364370 RepID=UPI0037AB362C
MDYRRLFRLVQTRPGMYGLDGSFKHYEIFLTGCDAGNEWGLLAGFREWLIMRLGRDSSLVWGALTLQIAFPDGYELPLSQDADRVASGVLFDLLDEFMQARFGANGISEIFNRYSTWSAQSIST